MWLSSRIIMAAKRTCSLPFLMNFIRKSVYLRRSPVTCLRYLIREMIRFRMHNPELARIIEQEFAIRSPRLTIIQSYTFPIWNKVRVWLEQGKERGMFQFRSLDSTMINVLGVVLFQFKAFCFDPILTEGTQTLMILSMTPPCSYFEGSLLKTRMNLP